MGPPRRVWSGSSRSEVPDPQRVCFVGACTLILPLVAAWAASSLGSRTVARRARARRGSEPCSRTNGSTRGCHRSGRAMLALAAMDTLSPDRRAAWAAERRPIVRWRECEGSSTAKVTPGRIKAEREEATCPGARTRSRKDRFELANGNTGDFDTERIGFRRFSTNVGICGSLEGTALARSPEG